MNQLTLTSELITHCEGCGQVLWMEVVYLCKLEHLVLDLACVPRHFETPWRQLDKGRISLHRAGDVVAYPNALEPEQIDALLEPAERGVPPYIEP